VKFSAFNTFYLNRNSHGEGVAILVKKSIQADPLTHPQTPNVEAVGTTIKLNNNKSIDIISVYCPDGNANTKQDITDILNTLNNS
jgi:exonuclease III